MTREYAQQDDLLRTYSWLREIFKQPSLLELFSEEEKDQLFHYVPATQHIKNIQSTSNLADCIQSIREKPLDNFVTSWQKKLTKKIKEHANYLVTTQVQECVNACRKQKQSLAMEHIQKSMHDISHVAQLAQNNNDIVTAETTQPIVRNALTKLHLLKAKLLLRNKRLHNDEDIPSKIKRKIERQELKEFLQQPSILPRQNIDTTQLYGAAIKAVNFR